MASGDIQRPYSAAGVIVIVGGVIVTGFGDGDFITASYDEDRYMAKSGADGEIGIAENASMLGTIEITTSSTSNANAFLSKLFNLGVRTNKFRTVPVRVTDLAGNSVINASQSWLKTAPDFTFGKEVGERVWVLAAADLVYQFG